MKEEHQQQLSAFVDGEIDRSAGRFLVRRLAADRDLQSTWSRYHLIRSCMQREYAGHAGLVERVRSAIGAPGADRPDGATGLFDRRTWLKAAAGGALAASVALFAIVGVNRNLADLDEAAGVSATGFVSQSNVIDRQFNRQPIPVGYSATSLPSPLAQDVDHRGRLNTFVIRHHQASGASGIISFAPILTESPTPQPIIDDPAGRPESGADARDTEQDARR